MGNYNSVNLQLLINLLWRNLYLNKKHFYFVLNKWSTTLTACFTIIITPLRD